VAGELSINTGRTLALGPDQLAQRDGRGPSRCSSRAAIGSFFSTLLDEVYAARLPGIRIERACGARHPTLAGRGRGLCRRNIGLPVSLYMTVPIRFTRAIK